MFFINSTVLSSFNHLPFFLPQLGLALLLVFLFSVPALFFIKRKIIPLSILLVSSTYLFTALFIIFADISSRLGASYTVVIPVLFAVLVCIDVFAIYQNKQIFIQIKSYISRNKILLVSLILVTLSATFLLSKFVFQNGLHDEWQHHAVVEDMLIANHLPIRNEYIHSMNISDYYHYGWYYLVILVKMLFSISIETALDVTKLFLFVPILPLFFTILSRFLKNTTWVESLFFSIVLLFQGPSMFLADSYSKTVLFGITNPIIYQPLFFQLAGITWYGLIFTLIFSTFFYYLLKTKNIYVLISFVLFSFYSLFLLNKAYFFFQLVVFILLACSQYVPQIKRIFQTKKIHLLVFAVLLLLISSFAVKMFFPTVFTMMIQTSQLVFLRSFDKWGLPYEFTSGLQFAPVFSREFIFSFGLVIFLPLLLPVIHKKFMVGASTVLLYIVYIFTFLVPYGVNFSGSELALNKFYIILMSVSFLISLFYYQIATYLIRKVLLIIAIFSIVSPLLYFASAYPVKQQIYWNYSDEIIESLKNSSQNRLLVVYDDKEYAKFLINNLDIELVHKNRYDRGYSEKIKYLVSDKKNLEYELLAKTNKNYLYQLD